MGRLAPAFGVEIVVLVLVASLLGPAAMPPRADAGEPAVGETADTIARELDDEARRERRWWNAWTATYAAFTVGQGAAAGAVHDRDTRIDMEVGAATSVLGVVGMLLSPLREVARAADTVDRMPARTEEERRARAETAVVERARAAAAEREARSWLVHVLNVVVTGASSVVLWQGFDHGTSAATNLASGVAIGELQIWTQPKALLAPPPDPPLGGTVDVPRPIAASPPAVASVRWGGRSVWIRVAF